MSEIIEKLKSLITERDRYRDALRRYENTKICFSERTTYPIFFDQPFVRCDHDYIGTEANLALSESK